MSTTIVFNGGTGSSVDVPSASTQIVEGNKNRRYLHLKNETSANGGARLFLSIGEEDAEDGKGIYLDPGEEFIVKPDTIYKGPLSAICPSGTTTLYIQENQ